MEIIFFAVIVTITFYQLDALVQMILYRPEIHQTLLKVRIIENIIFTALLLIILPLQEMHQTRTGQSRVLPY